ncbi:MAG: AEC family transporter [Bacillota bacterium]|nr:AEC family transporter [Bacillota bacterium]
MKIITQVIAPLFLVIGLGYLLERRRALDTGTIAALALYVLNPALTLRSFLTTPLAGAELGKVALFALLLACVSSLLVQAAVRLWRLPRPLWDLVALTTLFMNSGHYGVPVNYFAFGQAGFTLAVTFMAFQSVLTNSWAVYLTCRQRWGVAAALGRVVRMPLLYAMLAALALRQFHLALPVALEKGVALLADGAIPVSLLMVGIQLAETAQGFKSTSGELTRAAFLSVGLRLVAAPLLAWFLTAWLGIGGLLRKVLLVEAATPTAVMTVVLSTEFDHRADFTARVVFLSTLASSATITVLLWLLQRWG